MRLSFATIYAFAAVASPAAVSAQENSAPSVRSTPDQASIALAEELARIATDDDQLAIQLPANFSAAFVQSFKNEGSYEIIERASPGIVQAMLDAVVPIYNDSARARLPALRGEIRDIYLSHMNFEEMSELHAFYISPLGVKLLAILMSANRDGNITAAATGGPTQSTEATTDRLMTGINGAVASNADKFSQAEMKALIVATSKPALLKMGNIGRLILQATVEWDKAIPPPVLSEIKDQIKQIAAERLGT